MAAWPAGVIRPALVSAATRFLLSPDQRLFGLRGVKICRKKLLVERQALAVDPAEAERFFDGLVPVERRQAGVLLGVDQQDAGRRGVVLLQPRTPRQRATVG